MKRLALRTLGFAAFAAGAALALSSPAQADTIGNGGILSGNSVSSVIQVPVNVCGNAIGILGNASAQCTGGAWAINGGGSGGASGFFARSHTFRTHGARAHSVRAHGVHAHSTRVKAASHTCPGSA